ncbi:MAG: hypothetical protein KDA89_12845 [Planctomycetaceae bacterium]|nr:hypothetical protein [Planctomycetaceae bacterium]
MPDPNIDITGSEIPSRDGDIREFAYKEAVSCPEFDRNRKVIFINGMLNSGRDHTESALALSWVQMCSVIGVYNASAGGWKDFTQCVSDKGQFNGPTSLSARNKVRLETVFGGISAEESIRRALGRNRAQVALFDLLRKPENRRREIFAHSQGNLILSNVLQAIDAVDGRQGLLGRTIHTFGSPAVSWPSGITKYEHGFTWDPITFLAGFDLTWSISKVGMPGNSLNPITHSFLQYMARDAAFVVNRYRVGGLGVTFRMDEAGLARALAAMGTNMRRVSAIFEHLNKNHNSDADDVAMKYIDEIRRTPATVAALKNNKSLVNLLVRVLDEGWTTAEEKQTIAYLRSL